MAGGDLKMLVFCNSEWTVAVVVCIGAGLLVCFCRRMWIFACPLLKPVYTYGVMISGIDSRLWK